jgi:ArsR family transcriptional regulator, arsenate/arsenite/antimonite-responsive transcriptional repressor
VERTLQTLQMIEASPAECCRPVTASDITNGDAATLASLFKALGDPHRVRIVNLLANSEEPVCVCDFMPVLGLSQGTVSFHLKKLLGAGLVTREQRGTWAYYSLDRSALGRLAGVFASEGEGS